MGRHRHDRQPTDPDRSLSIVMLGTRGVPAAYGGFETAVEEISRRLVARGHRVTVYCRTVAGPPTGPKYYGMYRVELPAIRLKVVETLSHTALSVVHVLLHRRPDVSFVFNAANAPFIPVLHLRRIPTAVHVDGLEWQRGKWGPLGRRYYRWAEQLSVRQADTLIADAQGIVDYYDEEFAIPTQLISYGTKMLRDLPFNKLTELGLTPGGYHLVVARLEPENHVDVIIDGYRRSCATQPLVVVGSAPYAAEFTTRIGGLAAADSRVRMLGGVWDQQLLDQLYAHATTYLHGHSVGGTNPSLLRAMGAGTPAIAWNVIFNREVLGSRGRFFETPGELAVLVDEAERDLIATAAIGEALQRRAARLYDWDAVADRYEDLAQSLASGLTARGVSQGHGRRPAPPPAHRAPTPIDLRTDWSHES